METKEKSKSQIHANHRKRLQNLIYTSDLKNLSEIQILEYILTFCIPRKDTNPLAHNLLDEFGTIGDVLEADYDRILSVKGIGPVAARTLKSICKIFHYNMEQTKTKQTQLLSTPAQIIDFFRAFLDKKTNENFYMASLTPKSELIKVDKIADGTVNKISLDIRKISEFAIKNNASLVIVAHNHPDGNPQPSGEDISATSKIFSALSVLGVGLVDHIIISKDSYFSFYSSGLLDHIMEAEHTKQSKLSNKIFSLVVDQSQVDIEAETKRANIYEYPTNKNS